MDETNPPGDPNRAPSVESTIDWTEVLKLVRRTIGVRLYRTEMHEIDELAAEAWVRVLRAVKLQSPDNLEAFATTIAQNTHIDFVRRRQRQAALHDALLAEGRCDASPSRGDELERLRFLALEFFRGTSCGELAEAYFSEVTWKQHAARVGRSPDAVRKEWERCVMKLRAAARKAGSRFAWMGRAEDAAE